MEYAGFISIQLVFGIIVVRSVTSFACRESAYLTSYRTYDSFYKADGWLLCVHCHW